MLSARRVVAGTRGTIRREDQSLKRRAERSLLILGEGKLPAKNKQRASFPSRDNVHPPAGASLGGSPGCPSESAEAQGVGSALPGEPVTPSGASGNAGIKRRASERSTGERSAGDGDEEGAEEDEGEDGEEEKAYTVWGDDQKVPPAQAVFIQQVRAGEVLATGAAVRMAACFLSSISDNDPRWEVIPGVKIDL